MRSAAILLLLCFGLLFASCAGPQVDTIDVPEGSLGSFSTPVKCDMPAGEREYLDRLVGPGDEEVTYERLGNCGEGPSGNVIDGYAVTYAGKDKPTLVHMDMYHSGHKETSPIDGFKIKDP